MRIKNTGKNTINIALGRISISLAPDGVCVIPNEAYSALHKVFPALVEDIIEDKVSEVIVSKPVKIEKPKAKGKKNAKSKK